MTDAGKRAREIALRIPAPCVCADVPLCNQHKIAAELIAAALTALEKATAAHYRRVLEILKENVGHVSDSQLTHMIDSALEPKP